MATIPTSNTPVNAFLTIDGIEGPVTDIVPKSFAVKKFALGASRGIQPGRSGLQNTGDLQFYDLELTLTRTGTIALLYHDCFNGGKASGTASLQVVTAIQGTNKPLLTITLKDAVISMVVDHYEPQAGVVELNNLVNLNLANMAHVNNMDNKLIHGGIRDRQHNNMLFNAWASHYPDLDATKRVLVKLEFSALTIELTKYEDSGSAAGKEATTVDLQANTVKAG